MGITELQISERMEKLKKPGIIERNGSFYMLFANGRWHLITAGYTAGLNSKQFIQTVHFMDNDGVKRYFSSFLSLEPVQLIADQFIGFEDEVKAKILPNAEDYLPLLESGQLLANTGITTDTISVGKIGAHGDKFVSAIQKVMDTEVLGFCLEFTGTAG